MSFRARLTLAVAMAVAVAVAGASALTYVLVRNELRGEVDSDLRSLASTLRVRVLPDFRTGEQFLGVERDQLGGASGYAQIATADGDAIRPPGATVRLPIGERPRRVATGTSDAFFADATVADTHVRV